MHIRTRARTRTRTPKTNKTVHVRTVRESLMSYFVCSIFFMKV